MSRTDSVIRLLDELLTAVRDPEDENSLSPSVLPFFRIGT